MRTLEQEALGVFSCSASSSSAGKMYYKAQPSLTLTEQMTISGYSCKLTDITENTPS